MSRLSEKEFIASIKSNNIAPFYYFYGDEKYLINYYTKSLTLKLLDKNINDFNYTVFDFNSVTLDDIENEIESIPVFSANKCILIKYFNPESVNKNDVKRFLEILNDTPDGITVIITDNEREINYKKADKIKKFATDSSKIGCVVKFEKRDRNGLIKFIISRAKSSKVALSEQIAAYIVDNCSDDIEILSNEVDKVINYAVDGELNKEVIDKLITKRNDANVFEILNLIIKGHREEVFLKLNELFYQREDAVAIIAILSSAFIDLYRAKTASENGVFYNQVTTDFGYGNLAFKIKNAFRDSANLNIESLRKSIEILAHTDLTLKSTSLDKNICLEQCVAKLLVINSCEV